jgi:hypothetical protein
VPQLSLRFRGVGAAVEAARVVSGAASVAVGATWVLLST